MQDPCGRLLAPDSYAGSAAPGIAGFGGHPPDFHAFRASRATGTTPPMFVKAFFQWVIHRICRLLRADKTGKGRL
jgi:hypothetical protein